MRLSNGSRSRITMPSAVSKSPCDRWHRQAVDHEDRLLPRVALGQPGIRGVVHRDSDPGAVGQAVGQLDTGAELEPGAEIGAAAAGEIAGGAVRGQHPFGAEIDVKAKPGIAVERAVAGAGNADKRCDRPEHIAETVFGAAFGGCAAALEIAGRSHVESAEAERQMWRIAGRADGDLRRRRPGEQAEPGDKHRRGGRAPARSPKPHRPPPSLSRVAAPPIAPVAY